MAATPATAAAAGAATTSLTTQLVSFVASVGLSYMVGRLGAQDGPRVDNLTASQGEYGVGMPRIFGSNVRLAGIFIAQADIHEVKHTIGSTELNVGIGALTGAAEGFSIGSTIPGVGSLLGAGIGAVVGGLFGAALPKQHYYTYEDTFALMLADRSGDDPIVGISKAWAQGQVIFSGAEPVLASTYDTDGRLVMRKYGKNRWFESLTIYTGSTSQGLDPILAVAVNETSAYPFTAHAVFEKLQLAQWGNSVPPIEFLINVSSGQTLAAVAERIISPAGIDSLRSISTTAVTSKTVRGYAVTNDSSCWDALKPLLPAFGVDLAEVSGQLRFLKRGTGLRATLPIDDMGASADGNSAPELFTFTRASDLSIPRETSLTFVDPAFDFQENTASSTRSAGNAKSNISVTLPLVMTASEAASAAALMHWDACLGRTALSFSVTDKWISLEPGLTYAIPYEGTYIPYRVTRRARGANGVIEVESVSDEAVTYTASVAGADGTPGDEDSTDFAMTRLVVIDMSILNDAHDDFGFYVVMAGSQAYWDRATIQMSSDGVTYTTLLDSDSSGIIGDVTGGALPAGSTTGLDDTLDITSVLTVELLHDGMELASATDAELDAWANFAFVGKNGQGEYIQFKTATKIAPKIWQLTNLRRGRRGSDWALGLHMTGEEFALLGTEAVFRIIYSDSAKWGVPMTLKGVSLHEDVSDAATVAFTNTGEGKRPYSPVDVEGTWDGGYNLSATFTRRSRFDTGIIGTDSPESYEVDIIGPDNHTVIRTLSVTSEAFTYTAAEAAADGLLAGGICKGTIYQINPDRGRGHGRFFTLIGPLGIRADCTLVTADTDTLTADYSI